VPTTVTPPGVALYGVGQNDQEGLVGTCNGSAGFGVEGESDSGSATTAYGVYDVSYASAGYGVYGVADGAAATGVFGQAFGPAAAPSARTAAPPSARGTSDLGHGAVFGFSNKQGGIAVRGSIDPAVQVAPYTFAGVFDGTVVVSGSLFIGGNKSAYVKHPDGSHRALYCVESPESWFEDFGEGTLTNGKAEVKIDPDFAAVADTSAYHVFLTVAATPSAAAHATGKVASDLSGTFLYRVVAKRKDVKAEQLAKVELPKDAPFDAAKATTPPPPPPKKP